MFEYLVFPYAIKLVEMRKSHVLCDCRVDERLLTTYMQRNQPIFTVTNALGSVITGTLSARPHFVPLLNGVPNAL